MGHTLRGAWTRLGEVLARRSWRVVLLVLVWAACTYGLPRLPRLSNETVVYMTLVGLVVVHGSLCLAWFAADPLSALLILLAQAPFVAVYYLGRDDATDDWALWCSEILCSVLLAASVTIYGWTASSRLRSAR